MVVVTEVREEKSKNSNFGSSDKTKTAKKAEKNQSNL